MTMTLSLGWWLLPAAFTLGVAAWLFWTSKPVGSGYGAVGAAMYELIRMLAGLAALLFAWLIYFAAMWATAP